MVFGGVGASKTAENHEISQIFMIWGCGVGGAGGSRTIENALKFYDFHDLGLWCGGRGCLQNYRKCIKFKRYPWCGTLGWESLVARELLKIHKNLMIFMVLGTGASELKEIHENHKIFMVLDCGWGARMRPEL